MALFGNHKKAKRTEMDLRNNANAILQSLNGVRRLMESQFKEQSALLGQLEAMATRYQNRVETSADVSALDQISMDTLAFLDSLLRDNLLTDPQQRVELIGLAVQVLEKVYRIQSQCKKEPDRYLVNGLNAGCQAVSGKYSMLLRLQRYKQDEARLSQNETAYETRITALHKDGKKPGSDPELIQLVAEQRILQDSMTLINKTIGSESAAIPLLINAFELVDDLGISKAFMGAIEEATGAHVDMIAREQEEVRAISDHLAKAGAAQVFISEQIATQKTYGEQMLEQRIAQDRQASSQPAITTEPQVGSAAQYAPRQEEIL